MDHWQTLSGHDGLEIKSLTPISRGYLFTELFGLDRADPRDYVDLNYKTKKIEYKHPLKFMNEFRRLVLNMWRSSFEYTREKYSRISEIEFSIYYIGSTRGTEQLIAKFGLSRNSVQSTSFAKLRHKDGTFQDYIKQSGTYWLHQAIPDMGTPAHLLSRRNN